MTKFQVIARDAAPAEEIRPDVHQRYYLDGADGGPELFEVTCEAGYQAPQHAHDCDEVIYVLEGGLRFGARECGPGATVVVPAEQMYRFTVGPAGCRFLNYRTTRAGPTIFKDEILSSRTRGGAATDDDG